MVDYIIPSKHSPNGQSTFSHHVRTSHTRYEGRAHASTDRLLITVHYSSRGPITCTSILTHVHPQSGNSQGQLAASLASTLSQSRHSNTTTKPFLLAAPSPRSPQQQPRVPSYPTPSQSPPNPSCRSHDKGTTNRLPRPPRLLRTPTPPAHPSHLRT